VSISFYFDHNMPLPLAAALRQRGIDVMTTIEDGANRLTDPELWRRATALSRIVVTLDQDFLAMAQKAQSHPGLVFCDVSGVSTRLLADNLELIALAMEPPEFHSKIFWVPM
jgi:predicted nuclease of predicted toxin-antitoxin system